MNAEVAQMTTALRWCTCCICGRAALAADFYYLLSRDSAANDDLISSIIAAVLNASLMPNSRRRRDETVWWRRRRDAPVGCSRDPVRNIHDSSGNGIVTLVTTRDGVLGTCTCV